MMRLLNILNLPLSTLIKEEYKNIKDSKHSPVYRKSGVEGFAPLFSFFFVNLGKADSKMRLALQCICLGLGILLIPLNTTAQIKGVIVGAYFDQDNAVMGDSTDLDVYSKFISSTTGSDTTVMGNVFFRYQTNWMYLYNPLWTEVLDNNPGWETVNAGIQPYHLRIFCNPNPDVFRTGPVNVIIIWPAFFNPATPLLDSADFHLFNQEVNLSSVPSEGPQDFGSTVFPNPAESTQLVFIDSKYSGEIIQVSIMNCLGQIINTKEFSENENSNGYILPTENLRAGIYNIHIKYKDNKSEVVKFIKN